MIIKKVEEIEIDIEKIKEARIHERKLSMRELEKRSGVTRKTIANIEKGKAKRSRFITIEKLAAALGYEISDFAKDTQEK